MIISYLSVNLFQVENQSLLQLPEHKQQKDLLFNAFITGATVLILDLLSTVFYSYCHLLWDIVEFRKNPKYFMDSKFIVLNDYLLVENISLQSGLTTLMSESQTPLMSMTKRNVGIDSNKIAFRKFISILLMSFPNMIANAI